MMSEFPNILSSYDPVTDYDALEKLKRPGLARWNKGVELRQFGLPMGDVMLINPHDSDGRIMNDIVEFIRRWKVSGYATFMTLRPDSINPARIPFPSNHILRDADTAFERVRETHAAGFVPSLWAYDNLRVARPGVSTVMFETPERIVIEILGPGHDAGDLSKGVLRPPIIIRMSPFAPALLEFKDNMQFLPFYLDIHDESMDYADAGGGIWRSCAPNGLRHESAIWHG